MLLPQYDDDVKTPAPHDDAENAHDAGAGHVHRHVCVQCAAAAANDEDSPPGYDEGPGDAKEGAGAVDPTAPLPQAMGRGLRWLLFSTMAVLGLAALLALVEAAVLAPEQTSFFLAIATVVVGPLSVGLVGLTFVPNIPMSRHRTTTLGLLALCWLALATGLAFGSAGQCNGDPVFDDATCAVFALLTLTAWVPVLLLVAAAVWGALALMRRRRAARVVK
ncbi:hypothetical protein MIND_00375200 [Mycena indigotica]|uniref:Uncharacterized protein n=1 Tax=Mycena indigotica TaxID=2126181 RepID=A0A8H6WCR8_9AGAR|nr:uncharacterized protein MIND_00375200 [Mycena indigotica]KAF7310023.1 hypothetical protein MIND_00375200 [Mycena indigotica]